MMHKYIIDTKEKLQQFCEQLSHHSVIALDTEFLREKTYYAQLCLIQIATPDDIACIDPLTIDDINSLLNLLYDPARVKVIHSARQDLELFYDMRGELPENIFDTQVAATLLGFGDQIGYAKLVKSMKGVNLEKAHTRTDWSRRPLSDEQIEYALDDVRYLLEIYHTQVEILEKSGRSDWLARDFAALSNPATYRVDKASLWQRVRGSNILKGIQLCVLQELAVWREHLAKQKNRPRRWIVRDDLLIEIAKRLPVKREQLEQMRDMDSGPRRYADTILQIIDKARQIPADKWPKQPKFTRLTAEQEAKVEILMAIVKLRAESNRIPPNVLASRKEIEAVVAGKPDLPVLSGWRNELVGRDLLDFLNGRCSVQMVAGALSIVTTLNQASP